MGTFVNRNEGFTETLEREREEERLRVSTGKELKLKERGE